MGAFDKISVQLNGGADYGHAKRNHQNNEYLKSIQGKSFAEVLEEEMQKVVHTPEYMEKVLDVNNRVVIYNGEVVK